MKRGALKRASGLKNLHGLRHAYVQNKYKELTGLEPPINSGPTKKQMNVAQKNKDQLARKVMSNKLACSRVPVMKICLG
jgi:hypothetical protein